MDDNKNMEPRQYLMTIPIDLQILNIRNKMFFWKNIVQDLNEKPIKKSAIEKLRTLYISEVEWECYTEDGDVEAPKNFWEWVMNILCLGGKHVLEMIIEFKKSDTIVIEDSTKQLKIKLLESVHKWCGNLKAIKVVGNEVAFKTPEVTKQLKELCEGKPNISLQWVNIGYGITCSGLGKYIHKRFLSGENVHTMSIVWEQLLYLEENQAYQAVINLQLGNAGAGFTTTEKFQDLFVKTFPALKHLRLIESFNDVATNLAKFVNGVAKNVKLESFGVDQSFFKFANTNYVKIETVPKIVLDMKTHCQPSIGFLNQVTNIHQVVITSLTAGGEGTAIKNEIIQLVKNSHKTCTTITLQYVDGSEEEIKLTCH